MDYRRLRVEGGCYFFTVVTNDRRPVLAKPWAVQLFMTALQAVQQRHPFFVDAYVILPDHLHMIWSLPDGDSDFSTRWMLIKSHFARGFAKHQATNIASSSTKRSPWQNRFWEHLIDDDADYENHIEYIHFNPVHHGLVDRPSAWPHSSFHDFVVRGECDEDWGSDETPKLTAIDRRSE